MSKLICEPVTKARIAGILAETGRIYASIQAGIRGINNPAVVVSSAVSGEGKSLFTAGLGICAARNVPGRVLLIDAHWHAPMLHRLFDLSPRFDLDESLRDDRLESEVLKTGYDRLDLLPAPRDPDNLETTRMALRVVEALRGKYSLTIIDTPPILSTNRHMVDPAALAVAADGLTLTVLANKTSRQQVKKAKAMLDVSGARILGLVINQYCNPLAS